MLLARSARSAPAGGHHEDQRVRKQPAEVTDLFQAALDALPAHIAILDQAGTIVAVNTAWRDFGAANDLALSNDAVGANYLAVCRYAVASGDPHATSIVLGMRDVLSGVRETLVFDYPCHAPQERRWFAFRMTRLHVAGEPRFLVSHENVTLQRLQRNRPGRMRRGIAPSSRV